VSVQILIGDCREKLRELPDASVHCCVTSPPYFGLRDYGVDGQMGLEPTPDEFVAGMVDVFRELRRVLRDDGTLWLNIGDSYAGSGRGGYAGGKTGLQGSTKGQDNSRVARGSQKLAGLHERACEAGSIGRAWVPAPPGLKQKDLIGIPWMLAKALRDPYYTGRIKRIEDRIWLAAMIDGEGCMFIHKRKVGQSNGQGYERKNDTYGSGLEVANCHRAIVERCLEITGAGSICEQTKDRRQTLYRWNLRSNECRWVIEEIYPHLVGKQHQARLLIGCPSSGEKADLAHRGLIDLHNGLTPAIDFPAPKSLYEPGWYLRQDIIWSKSNPMPESVRDRCTKAHEYLFMLSKSARYHYDTDAIAESSSWDPGKSKMPDGWDTGPGGHGAFHRNGREKGKRTDKQRGHGRRHAGFNARWDAMEKSEQCSGMRNKRSVWEVATQPFSEAHFATYPPALIEPCILAGCPEGGTVLDPFFGAGTTGLVADRLGRNCIGIELNPEYAAIAERRLNADSPLFAEVKAA
jgi:DNA modification methylase